jgi:feruloyl-CoA synthase
MRFGVTRALVRSGEGGTIYLRADKDLLEHAHRMTDRLIHWAEIDPGARRRREGST